MPIYQVMTPSATFDASLKPELAKAFTRIHASVTGAPAHFVHVVFSEVEPDSGFRGGEASRHTRIIGVVRAGRTPELIERLLTELSSEWHRITGQAESELIIALLETPGRDVIEDGRILPEPGAEYA
jgi:phenylpyruvate tautomerase PptA (4-oxalocrotonate tautomerase family)